MKQTISPQLTACRRRPHSSLGSTYSTGSCTLYVFFK